MATNLQTAYLNVFAWQKMYFDSILLNLVPKSSFDNNDG